MALSEQQTQALAEYSTMMKTYPGLFTGRESRPIVRDLEALEAYAQERNVVLGVVAATPYLWFVNDLVESRTGDGTFRHPYLRLIPPPAYGDVHGVVALATTGHGEDERVVLVRTARHATGTVEIELPRGFGMPGSTGEQDALRELREETGYVGERAHLLGRTFTDTGSTSIAVAYFHVEAPETPTTPAREAEEAIEEVLLIPLDEVWNRIDSGEIRDGFTVQALGLFQRLRSAPRR
jgi:ADP-ribose pyrophosphatase